MDGTYEGIHIRAQIQHFDIKYFRLIGLESTRYSRYSYSRIEATEEVLSRGDPLVWSGATKGVLSEGYPPVGSGATKGVLSQAYMLACVDQVLHQNHVRHSTFPIKNMAEKHGGNFRAFYTASDDRISLPEA